MVSLFGTSGIRGPVDTFFTPQFCFDIGRTFAVFLKRHDQSGTVTIGIDTRESSPQISRHVTAGLNFEKREVIYLGAVPVPAVHNSIITTSAVAGIMVTGSHIDPSSNGLKFFAFKEEISKENEQEITDIYHELKDSIPHFLGEAKAESTSVGFENYVNTLLSLNQKDQKPLKMVVDPGNGAQTEVLKSFLSQTPHTVEFINSDIQQPLLSRDTETDGAFSDLQKAVTAQKSDLGVGFDSDGDRVVFVDHTGRFVSGDYSGALLAKWNQSNIIVTPVNTGNVINTIGKEIIRTRVGSPFVVEAIKHSGSGFGFESNGGGIHADVMLSRDGGTSFVRILNILHYSQKSLAELIDEFPESYLRREKFKCPIEKNELILEKARHFLAPKSIDTTDGLKLILDDNTWILFRPSSNAPEFRVFVESNSATKSKQLINDAINFAQKLANV